jgi:prepilin-type N-terminal cleavage/methylation domain-containing protein
MMQKGFSLIEVTFGLLISSMIALILFESLSQSNKILSRVVSVSSIERKVALMQHQLETDFSGIFPPRIIEKEDDEQESQDKDREKEKSPSSKKPDKKEKEQENGFKTFSFESDDRGFVSILSFVTTNPLSVYQQPSPRAVRVAYRVIADPENQGKLLLIRQESEELSLKKFEAATKKETIKSGQKPIRGYEIARDIENIKFEFFVEKIEKSSDAKTPEGPQEGKDKDKKKEEEKPRVFILIDDWKKLSDDEKKKYETPEIPAFCSLKIFMNDERKHVHTFEFLFSTCAGYEPVIIKGVTSLPSSHETQQRKAGQEETDRMFLHGGIPQPQGAVR